MPSCFPLVAFQLASGMFLDPSFCGWGKLLVRSSSRKCGSGEADVGGDGKGQNPRPVLTVCVASAFQGVRTWVGRTRALLALLESCEATRQFASALKMLGLLKVPVVESDLKNDVNDYVGFFLCFVLVCVHAHMCAFVCVCLLS